MTDQAPNRKVYGSEYFAHHCGPTYDRSEPHWLAFFSDIADNLVRELKPRSVLDVGCAKGFLVEALRDRGVEAWGFDFSEYAISKVRPDIRPFCWVASATAPITRHYDLITCIEVLEHLPEQDCIVAVRNMTAASDAVLFSSTPSGVTEPTRQNVQPVLYWLKLFRDFHFAPDANFFSSFISPQAMLLRKSEAKPSEEVLFEVALARHITVEATLYQQSTEARDALGRAQRELEENRRATIEAQSELAHLRTELQAIRQHLADLENGFGQRLTMAFRRRRDRLFPAGTRRRTWSDLAQRASKILLLDGVSAFRSAWRKHRSHTAPADIGPYTEWIAANEPGPNELLEQRKQASAFQYRPLISAIMPVYAPDASLFEAGIQSLIAQTYDNWELCAAGTAPAGSTAEISQLAAQDRRIRLSWLPKNLGISGNSNECLRVAKGEFVVFLDQDDTLAPFALYEVARRLNAQPNLDFIYTDRDLLTADGSKRFSPLCKPDWSPEVMLSANYLSHMAVIRRELVNRVGGFRPEFDGAQDWDLFLRVLDETDRIAHIPVIAYHWREVSTSAASGINAKPYAQQKQLEVVTTHLGKLGLQATAIFTPSGPLRVRWPVSGQSLVSIIIPNRDRVDLLRRCVESLAKNTLYQKFEIVIVENGSADPATFLYYDQLQDRPNVRVVTYDRPFNYSAVNNFGAQHASGNLLLFLNNDTEAIDLEWLEEMMRWAERPEIGAVGAKLLYKDGRIQHAGVVVGLTGFAGHVYSGCREGQWDCFGSTEWYRNYLAVTGACLMVRKDVFAQAGGYDERFELCGSDVEFCLRLRDLGYRTVYTPFAKLLHHESAARGTQIPADDFQRSFVRYERYLRDGDPFFNLNLSYWHTAPRLRNSRNPSRLQAGSRRFSFSSKKSGGNHSFNLGTDTLRSQP